MDYLTPAASSSEFKSKPEPIQRLINEALTILAELGIPMKGRPRRLERMALAFLAVADVTQPGAWASAKDATSGRSLKTRDIIAYVNTNFGENISPGSYDDIRRQDLLLLVEAGVVVQTQPDANTNNPTRGYALNEDYMPIIRTFGSHGWEDSVTKFLENTATLTERLAARRVVPRIPISLPSGAVLSFTPGGHNELIRDVIEQFLPRFGYGAQVLYVGDAAKKRLLVDEEQLTALKFFELQHDKLPDVVAYSHQRNWLYLVEAVFSSGPISSMRMLTLRRLTAECTAEIVFVTAFPNRETFRKWAADIAWETEVWIADDPDHLVHFNGEKFLGPYQHPIDVPGESAP